MFSTNIICSAAMVFVWTSPGLGQSFTYSQSSCVGSDPVTAFPNCNYLYDTIDKCSGPTVEGSANYISCMCNQELFNSYFGYDQISIYNTTALIITVAIQKTDSALAIPRVMAPSKRGFPNGTAFATVVPLLPSLHHPYRPSPLHVIQTSTPKSTTPCQSGQYSQQECHSSYPKQPVSFSSCFCEPALLSMDYTCLYLQNVSCFSTPAALTNLAGVYPYCTNLFQVLGSVSITLPIFSSFLTIGI